MFKKKLSPEKKQKVKNFFKGIYFGLAVKQLEKVAEMLKGHWSGTLVNDRLNDLSVIVEIITDQDPQNVAQLKKFLDDNRERILDGAIQTAINLVSCSEKIDPEIKAVVVQTLEDIKKIQVFEQAEITFPDEKPPLPVVTGVTPLAGKNGAVAQVV